MTPLTKKQNEFARAYAELGNALQAYATADYSQNNPLPTQQREALRPSGVLSWVASTASLKSGGKGCSKNAHAASA